ncbi:DUF948 domain-containing protein [Streptomyces cinnamoneus]|uniref:DUF948 domain-containing protein n=1 Tax=Streptomyces cinnamoneus TaxID=53446 RepID=A0A918WFM1_STRCJ|nr:MULTISPECIES: DUF948 domain-containing protein [Streptomyces]MCA6093095.1 DUF948 domain-containing protein [Streptomyces sichuanensis]GHC42647.1 hypothetical protein GCM10010507_16650 [Streptomyces cinnamoneus]
MSGGEVAGILVAVFWAILVSFIALVLVRLAQTLKAATRLVAEVSEQAVPLLAEASATVRSANTQLARVDSIAADVQEVTANASALSSTVSTAFGGPLVKVAAFGYGVRRAMGRKAEPARGSGTVFVGRAAGQDLPSARRGSRRTRKKG